MKLVIAATGASGTIYLQRLLEQIDCAANEVHLVLSGHAKQVAAQEVDKLVVPSGVSEHGENDLNVPFVSGSARFDAMVIVPCSMATLGRIASGCSDTALLRAADELHADAVLSEATWSALAARYPERQLVEVPMVVGQYHMVAFLVNSLGVEPDPGSPPLPRDA